VDFSQHFVDAAREMQSSEQKSYTIYKQGKVELQCTAQVAAGVDKTKVSFEQGDACNLANHLGAL
jgi:hypothetical protein